MIQHLFLDIERQVLYIDRPFKIIIALTQKRNQLVGTLHISCLIIIVATALSPLLLRFRYLLCWWLIGFSLLWEVLLHDILLVEKVVFLIKLAMEVRAYSRKFKRIRNLFFLKSGFNLVLEGYELVFHLGVDVSVIVWWPKSPEGITNNISKPGLLFNPKNVLPQLL